MSDRFTVALSAAALASLVLVAACGSDATEPNEIANTRFVNASASTSSISATNEGRVVASGLAFQNTNMPTTCSTVEHGSSEKIDFTLGGTNNELGQLTFPFVAQQNYTVVFYAPNTFAVYPEVFTTPGDGLNALRFINATAAAGDIYLTAPNDLITGAPTIGNLAAGQVSGFDATNAPGGTFNTYSTSATRVRLFNVGQTTNPRADFTITALPSNRVGTIVLTLPPSGASSPTGFAVPPCAS